jgi:hypothetical protein
MSSVILKRAPIDDNLEDYSVIEDGTVIGRIFFLDAVGHLLDPGQRPQRRLPPRGVRLRADARGGVGGVREELAAGLAAPDPALA